MAKVTIVRPATKEHPPVREHKVEGEPYRAAKPGHLGDPGHVVVDMSVAEAEALLSLMGKVCGREPTLDLYNTMERAGVKTERFAVNLGWGTEQVPGLTLVRQPQ